MCVIAYSRIHMNDMKILYYEGVVTKKLNQPTNDVKMKQVCTLFTPQACYTLMLLNERALFEY